MNDAPAAMPASRRNAAASNGSAARSARSSAESSGASSYTPGTAIAPRSSTSRASSTVSAVAASGTGPPHIPLWIG
jgi:hypothetical protein